MINDTLKPIGSGASGTTSVTWDSSNSEYKLQYSDASDTISYTLPMTNTNVTKGLIVVKAKLNSNTDIYPIYWGGARYRDSSGSMLEPYQLADSASVSVNHNLSGSTITVTVTDTYQSVARTKTCTYTIQGKTLIIGINSISTSGNNNYAGTNMERSYSTSDASIKSISYADDQPSVMVDNNYFYSVVIDTFKSTCTSMSLSSSTYDSSSVYCSTVTLYDKDSSGNVNALNETYYITLSSDIVDTVYKTSKLASSYRSSLKDYVVFDMWAEGRSYADNDRTYNGVDLSSREKRVAKLYDNWKMDKVYVIDHQWQRYTYDVMYPVHYPANPMCGSNSEYISFISTLKTTYSWLVGVHEDYWYMYPNDDNKYYDDTGKATLAKDASGNYRDAWYLADFDVMTKAIRAEKMKYFSDQESSQIADNYGCNASYLDVNTAWRPDTLNQITLDAAASDSRSMKSAIEGNKSLFDALHDRYGGPLSGEGGTGTGRFDSAYAGYVDAVERDIAASDDLNADIIVDYEVKYIRPLMANQGMGYYSRFFPSSQQFEDLDWDKYYAMSIAFAHAGLMGEIGSSACYSYWGKMYYMMQALQAQYLDTSVTANSIEYWDGNDYISVSQAFIDGYDFQKSRIKTVYSNGLTIYVNFNDDDWTVTYDSVNYTLDENGWIAGNSDLDFLEYSCLKDGNRVDYVDCSSYTYADARGTSTSFPGFTTQSQKLIRKNTGDSTALLIDNVKVMYLTDSSVVITWTTDKNSSSIVEYGSTTSYGSKKVPSLDFIKEHSVTLINLTANSLYHFRVRSEDIADNGTNSEDFVFMTRPSSIKASTQFSSTQGLNNWYYQYWNGSSYTNLPIWDSTNSVWKLDTDTNCFIGSTYQHPGASVDSARKWVATSAGWYQITGEAYKSTYESIIDSPSGDGLNIYIALNNDTVWSECIQSQERVKIRHDLTLYLTTNDALYFRENKNSTNACDGLYWDPLIIQLNKTSFTASTDFASDNGTYGWYYRTWDGDRYRDMTYSSGTWSESSAEIGNDWLKPSDTRDASRIWIASASGHIKITGTAKKKVSGGDGVVVDIMLNSQSVWNETIGAYDTTGYSHEVVIHVEPGDIVEFRVNRNSTSTSDDTTWDPTITYVKSYYTVDDISSTQGTNQWYYQKWDGSSYTNLTWNSGANKWELTGTYLAIDVNNMHPETSYDAVRKWVALNDGRVKVYGTIQRPTNDGDGIIAKALLNSIEYWSLTIDGTDTAVKTFSYYITVHAGDAIYFRLNRNSTIDCDTTTWKIKIEYDKEEYSAAFDFTSVQALNGWYYQRLNSGNYYDLSWSSDHWYYSTYLTMYAYTLHPEVNDDPVRKWVAPFEGTIRVKGTVKVNTSGGDGVVITIKHNSTTEWLQTVSGTKNYYYSDAQFVYDFTVDVNASDAIYFILNKNGNIGYDASTFCPEIAYTQKY